MQKQAADQILACNKEIEFLKTSGDNGVRKGADYIKNYFVSQYGAIKNIDFSPIFESELSEGNFYPRSFFRSASGVLIGLM